MELGKKREWMESLYEGSEAREFFESASKEYPHLRAPIADCWVQVMNEQSYEGDIRVNQILGLLEQHTELVKYTLGYFGGSGSIRVSLEGK